MNETQRSLSDAVKARDGSPTDLTFIEGGDGHLRTVYRKPNGMFQYVRIGKRKVLVDKELKTMCCQNHALAEGVYGITRFIGGHY